MLSSVVDRKHLRVVRLPRHLAERAMKWLVFLPTFFKPCDKQRFENVTHVVLVILKMYLDYKLKILSDFHWI